MENKKRNIDITCNLGICLSCEICRAVCPEGAIAMEYNSGQFIPKINYEKCTYCGICKKLCPGISIDILCLKKSKQFEKILDGSFLECLSASSKNNEIRKNSTSGGIITSLVIELIKNKEFDKVFLLDFDNFDGKEPRLEATDNIGKILKSAKSKYIPASIYNVIKTLKNNKDRKYIIIGTSCTIYGIKRFLEYNNQSEKRLLFLGLFCDKTLNLNAIKYFKDLYKKPGENIIKFQYRSKEKSGWPGDVKVTFNSGRELTIDRRERIQIKKFFQLKRCLFCIDKLNKLADISFGDCYIEGKKERLGNSSVIVRTSKGRKILNKYSYLFNLVREDINNIRKSQSLLDKKDNLEFARLIIENADLYPDINIDFDNRVLALKKLKKMERYIKWGQNYNLNKIRLSLIFFKLKNKSLSFLKHFKSSIGNVLKVLIVIFEGISIYYFKKDNKKNVYSKGKNRNIVIVGGNLFNKGSQAMIFSVLDNIRRRSNMRKIYLFSTKDFKRETSEKVKYKINFLPWDLKIKIRLISSFGKIVIRENKFSYLEDDIKKVLEKTDIIVDVSGYTFSTQWRLLKPISYLLNIIIAKKNAIKFFILPQSIGPFNYPSKIILYPLMRMYLKYPERIFTREIEGYKSIIKFTRKNVAISNDIILQNKRYNLSNIFNNKNVCIKDIKINANSICIIPNLKVVEQFKSNKIYSVYKSLIDKLIKYGNSVYILKHSYMDSEVCWKIKDNFLDKDNVGVLSDEFNAIELENIIKKFKFIIASRYHSIIHSYKNGVPALIIGWATKYYELAKKFDQSYYFFDCRSDIEISKMDYKLDKMMKDYKFESKKILNKVKILSKDNIFDDIF